MTSAAHPAVPPPHSASATGITVPPHGTTLVQVLRGLRWGVHFLVAALLVFSLVMALREEISWWALGASAVFAVAYALGWIPVLVLSWLVLVWHGQDFVWLEFPLVLVVLNTTGWWIGGALTLCMWIVAVVTTGAFLGPTVGTVVAVGIFLAYRGLLSEVTRTQAMAHQLYATQHEAGRMAERERLSREIHDTVAQGLSSIVLLSRSHAKDNEVMATIYDVARENLAEARRFVQELAPPDSQAPLSTTLSTLAQRTRSRAELLGEPLAVDIHVEPDADRLPPQVVEILLRIVQEGLSNAVAHAQASRVVVTVARVGDAVTVDVVDDGRGGLSATAGRGETGRAPWGFGLRGIASRVELAGGSFSIESSPGGGTALAVLLPLPDGDDSERTQA